MGLLVVEVAGHGGRSLGPDCLPVLRGEQSIALRRDPARKRVARGSTGRAPTAALDDPEDASLFQALRGRRAELAKAQGVPPYVIFHDSTLVEMARRRPADRQALGALPGVGEAKLARYGEDRKSTRLNS